MFLDLIIKVLGISSAGTAAVPFPGLVLNRQRGTRSDRAGAGMCKLAAKEAPEQAASFLSGSATCLSPHYPRKKQGSFLPKYKESHTPRSIKDP